MRYILQTAKNLEVFEEVDEYVFKNRKKALDKDEQTPRYTGVYIIVDGGTVQIEGQIPQKSLGVICRLLSVVPPTGNIPGGYVQEPETIMFLTKGGGSLLHQMNGDNFIRYRKSKAA